MLLQRVMGKSPFSPTVFGPLIRNLQKQKKVLISPVLHCFIMFWSICMLTVILRIIKEWAVIAIGTYCPSMSLPWWIWKFELWALFQHHWRNALFCTISFCNAVLRLHKLNLHKARNKDFPYNIFSATEVRLMVVPLLKMTLFLPRQVMPTTTCYSLHDSK